MKTPEFDETLKQLQDVYGSFRRGDDYFELGDAFEIADASLRGTIAVLEALQKLVHERETDGKGRPT